MMFDSCNKYNDFIVPITQNKVASQRYKKSQLNFDESFTLFVFLKCFRRTDIMLVRCCTSPGLMARRNMRRLRYIAPRLFSTDVEYRPIRSVLCANRGITNF